MPFLTKLSKSPLSIAFFGLFFYSVIVIFTLLSFGNHDLRDFALIGQSFITKSDVSHIIRPDPAYTYFNTGYDGQFAYFIALDPFNARFYMDSPAYRYTRILYPILGYLFSVGNAKLVPLTLVLLNLGAIFGGGWSIAAWCVKNHLSSWFALVYVLYIGQIIGFTLDVTDLLAYALVALAIYLLEKYPTRIEIAALVFALAGLTRETTLLFPLIFGIFMLPGKARPSTSKLVIFYALAFVPAALWQGVLFLWLGSLGVTSGAGLTPIPFSGLLSLRPFIPATLEVIQVILIPAFICFVVVLWSFWKYPQYRKAPALWLLLAHTVMFTVFLQPSSLEAVFSTGRITMGIVLASIYSLPYTKNKTWFFICAGLWLSATVAFALNPTSRLFH
jgi:hypothetical protein